MAVQKYAIYSPVLGFMQSIPSILLPRVCTADNQNIRFHNGEIESAKMRLIALKDSSGTAVGSPDGTAFLKYHSHQSSSGTKYTLGFTAKGAYYWNTSTKNWAELSSGLATSSGASTVTHWSVVSAMGNSSLGVVATNNVDPPLWWDGTTFSKGAMSNINAIVSSGVTITKAYGVAVFQNHIIFGNYALSNGNSYPWGIVSSDLAGNTVANITTGKWGIDNWYLDGTSDASAFTVEGAGVIIGLGVKADLLYVFKERSVRVFWYTATSSVYNSRQYAANVGCLSEGSIVQDAYNNLYFYASDLTFREVDIGIISEPVNVIARAINQSSLGVICATFIEEYGEVWWAIPLGSGITANNKVLCYQPHPASSSPNIPWSIRNMPVTAFGTYVSDTTWTWSLLSVATSYNPYPTWPDWNWDSWISAFGDVGFPQDICGGAIYDSSGAATQTYTFFSHQANNDNGVLSQAYFVLSTDLGDTKTLQYYKRILKLRVYLRNQLSGYMFIYAKKDNESDFSFYGRILLNGANDINVVELPVDIRAKHFQFKFHCVFPYSFLGVEFDYTLSGER